MNELAKNNPDKLVTIVEPLLKGLYADFQTKSAQTDNINIVIMVFKVSF